MQVAARHMLDSAGQALQHQTLEWQDGLIAAMHPDATATENLVLPLLANGHDHVRLARLSQNGSSDIPLEAWLPYLSLIPSVDPYLAACVAFGRSLVGGAGAVMAHYTRIQGLTDYLTEAQAVARAARDVGVRIAFAVQCRDRHPLVYGPSEPVLARLSPAAHACISRRFLRPPLPAADQIALVEATAAAIAGDGVSVQYGPAAVQWCSPELLAAIAEASAANGRRVHMHLLETPYQRAWADRAHPEGIVTYLDRIGLLTERLSLAHGTQLRPDEMALIARRGATIVVNTSSNLLLGAGLAPLAEMLRQGCRVAIGLDGSAFDEDEDALRELRLAYHLHKGPGFMRRLDRAEMLGAAFANGHFAISGTPDAGRLAAGAPADLLVLDWARLSAQLIEPDVTPADLLLARGAAGFVRHIFVGGRQVLREGVVTGIDLPAREAELLAALRDARPATADLRAAMPELRAALQAETLALSCCG